MLVLAALSLSACETVVPRQYSGEEMGAHVVDAKTKKPLEGVIVVAYWKLSRGTFGGTVDIGTLHVMEAVTDKDGQFHFPAWGPKTVWRGRLSGHSPTILFFKPGYKWKKLYPEWEGKTAPDPRRHWVGKAIELSKFAGSLKEYTKHFGSFNYYLDFLTDVPKNCDWKKVPQTLGVLISQGKIFEDNGMFAYSSLYGDLISNDAYYLKKGGRKCGSPKKFIEGLRQ